MQFETLPDVLSNGMKKTMRTRMKKIIFAALIAAMSTLAASGQVGQGVRHAPTDGGLDVTGPAAGQFFRMQIRGENSQRLRTKQKYWYRTDGVRFEFFSEETATFTPTNVPHALGECVVLEMYRSMLERRFTGDKIRSSRVKLASGKEAILLTHEKPAATPDGRKTVENEIFLVTTGPAYVFGLFAPVPAGGSESDVRRVLTRTLGTLTFSDDPFTR